MKRLLCLVGCIVSLQSFSQIVGTKKPYTTLYSDSFTYINKLILQQYCSDFFLSPTPSCLMDLYNPQRELHFGLDRNIVAIYNPKMFTYYFYPIDHTPNIETMMGRPTGIFYGSEYRDSFNPYGSSSPSDALLNGTINYLLNRK